LGKIGEDIRLELVSSRW